MIEDEESSAPLAVRGGGSRWRSWIARTLFESFLIVLSVIVALAVDQWRDGRERAQRVRAALDGVRAELLANRQAVERARAFHLETRDSLLAYQASGRVPSRHIYYERGMFRPARPVSTAWQSARETGIAGGVPYDLVLELSRVYGEQARYEALADRLAGGMYDDLRRNGVEATFRDGYAPFATLDEDFANREMVLDHDYGEALAAIEAARR